MHAVRVETRRMGGGFGRKESQGNALAVACVRSRRRAHGRPCKIAGYDRDENMIVTGKASDFRIDDIPSALTLSGRISALYFQAPLTPLWPEAMDLSLARCWRASAELLARG